MASTPDAAVGHPYPAKMVAGKEGDGGEVSNVPEGDGNLVNSHDGDEEEGSQK